MLKQSDPLDAMFQALADPSRRSMIERLTRGSATVSELAAPLDMSMPAVMQHLSVLEQSGLVRSSKKGRVRSCALEPAALSTVETWINQRRLFWQQSFDRLGAMLAEETDAT